MCEEKGRGSLNIPLSSFDFDIARGMFSEIMSNADTLCFFYKISSNVIRIFEIISRLLYGNETSWQRSDGSGHPHASTFKTGNCTDCLKYKNKNKQTNKTTTTTAINNNKKQKQKQTNKQTLYIQKIVFLKTFLG